MVAESFVLAESDRLCWARQIGCNVVLAICPLEELLPDRVAKKEGG